MYKLERLASTTNIRMGNLVYAEDYHSYTNGDYQFYDSGSGDYHLALHVKNLTVTNDIRELYFWLPLQLPKGAAVGGFMTVYDTITPQDTDSVVVFQTSKQIDDPSHEVHTVPVLRCIFSKDHTFTNNRLVINCQLLSPSLAVTYLNAGDWSALKNLVTNQVANL